MEARVLTDVSIRNLKPGPTRREIPDPGARGLYVIVQPSGRKSFAVRYRVGGAPRKLTLTAGMSLAAARKAAADAMYEVSQGRDPAEARKARAEKAERARADTLRSVAEEYLARERRRLRSIGQRERIFERLVYPVLGGGRPIGDIRRKDVVRLLDHVEDNHGARMADYTLAIVRRLFNWHAVRDDEFSSPIVRGMARQNAKEHERSRTLTDDELRAVWTAATAAEGPFGPFVKFLLVMAARRGEGSAMPWIELDGADWILPASRNKVKVDFVRPLSGAAREILAGQPRIEGCPFVFTSDGRRALAGFSRLKEKFDVACGVTGWTLHDLRRTARSLMSRAGVYPDIAERCLGHVIKGVRATYDRYEYYDEKQKAFEALAAQIERIVNPPQGDVVPLRGRFGRN
jgi:integrase